MKEIVYEETRSGVMEPQPTQAERRRRRAQERKAAKRRQERRETAINIVGFIALAIAFAVISLGPFWYYADKF